MELEKFIKVFDDTMHPKVIGSCVKYFNTLDFAQQSVIGENGKSVTKTNTRNALGWYFPSKTMTDVHWRNLWLCTFRKLYMNYRKFYNIYTDIRCDEIKTIGALKYEPGGFYVPHSDMHNNYPRTLSFIYFLNNDYEGGELVFHTPDRHCDETVIIKPAPGRCVIWPSNFMYPHSVKAVKKGTRYVLVSWMA